MSLDTIVEVTLAALLLVLAIERAILAREAWRRSRPAYRARAGFVGPDRSTRLPPPGDAPKS